MRQVLKPIQKQTSSLVHFGNRNGQSVVEYLLILIVTISLLLAFKPLFSGFGNFINDYVGEYTACLMEFGELPSLGVTNDDLKKHESGGGKVCSTKFAAYTFATGRQPIGSTGGSSTGNTKTSGSTSSTSDSDRDRNSSRNASSTGNKSSSSSKSDSDGNSADDAASASGKLNPYNSGKITRSSDYGRSGRGTTDGGGNDSAGSDNVKIIENAEKKDSALSDDYRNSSSRVSYERTRYRAITGEQQEELAKQTKTARGPSSKIVTVIDDTGRMGPRKSAFVPQERKPATVENKDEGFTIGSFMKWLIIAGMFIAIVLFFGGQAMNFMNSQEK